MRYLDASAAVPLFVKETSSPAIRRLFAHAAPRELVLSGWTVAEFTSALGIRTRMGTVMAAAAREAVPAFRTLARGTLTHVPVADVDLERAAELMLRFELGLRAGHALHVDIACERMSAATFVTLDLPLARAAQQLGMNCETPA